ncbi:MAG: VOC family protein [Caulobacter sp.]|nr:VOC family protein [Caulobacter sp.]
MTDQVENPPMRGVIPYLNLVGAADAAELYKQAFGAQEMRRLPADDGQRLMHCHLVINGGSLMLSDCFPEHGHDFQPSHSFTMQLVVDDIDRWFQRAVVAGLEVMNPVALMFWGDRWGSLKDRFGVHWAINESAKQV